MPSRIRKAETRLSDFRKALEALRPHDHACLIYESEKEWKDTAIPFFAIGLRRQEKCIYVTAAHTADHIRRLLRSQGIRVNAAEREGRLVILDHSEAHTKGGSFDAGKMIRLLKKETRRALKEGYTALRATGEMSWILAGVPGTEDFLEYEARLNTEFFDRYPCVALCQYDRRKFDAEIIKSAIMTHPLVVRRYAVLQNFYQIAPRDILDRKLPHVESTLWLRNLEHQTGQERARQEAEDRLREGEERFRSIFENSMDAILLTSPDGRIHAANPAACRMFLRTEEEICRIGRRGLVDPDDPRVEAALWERRTKGRAKAEFTYIRKDGTRFIGEVSSAIFSDSIGRERTSMIIRDVTDRSRLDGELKDRVDELAAIYESAPIMMLLIDGAWKIRKTNVRTLELANTTLADIVNLRCGEAFCCIHSLDAPEGCGFGPYCKECALRQSVLDTIKTGHENAGVETTMTLSGPDKEKERTLLFSTTKVMVRGECLALVIMEDITERRLMEEALNRSEERITAITNNVPALVSYVDKDGYYRFINARYEEWFGISPEEIVGRHYHDVLGPEVADKIDEYVKTALSGKRVSFEGALPYAHGGERWVLAEYVPDIAENGTVRGYYGLVTDITDRKKAEAKLRESERFALSVLNSLSTHIAVLDEEGTIMAVNSSWRVFAEANPPLYTNVNEGANYLAVCDAAQGEDAPQAQSFVRGVRQVMSGKQEDFSLEYPCHSPSEKRWFIVRATRFSGPGPLRIVVSHENVTERKVMEESLQESERRYRSVVEDQTEVICRFKADGTFTFVNDVYCRFFGKTPGELLGSKWHPVAVPNDVAGVERQLERLSPVNPVIVIENRVYAADGQVHWMQFVNRAFFDASGHLVETQSVGRDITERKRVEVALTASRQQMRALFANLQEVREEERTKISREIHDELGQSLTAIKIDVAWLRELLAHEGLLTGALKGRIDSLMGLIDGTVQNVREISLSLRPALLDDLGIAAALSWQARRFEKMTGIACTFSTDVEGTDIKEHQATALFRVCQECLTNVARHADATAVHVVLTGGRGNLVLGVEDNGRGITEDQAGSPNSLGILGMKERILNLGGKFIIGSRGSGRGTRVKVEVPIA